MCGLILHFSRQRGSDRVASFLSVGALGCMLEKIYTQREGLLIVL